jgi:hypothetical protein
MESISYDNTDLGLAVVDENFASTALDPVAAAARTGYKAFILTSNDGSSAEQSTDLGLAAVAVLTASDAGAGWSGSVTTSCASSKTSQST